MHDCLRRAEMCRATGENTQEVEAPNVDKREICFLEEEKMSHSGRFQWIYAPEQSFFFLHGEAL